MSKEEKILLIYILLKDVRCNFDDLTYGRVETAVNLCKELGGDFLTLADQCKDFMEDEFPDGRYFRDVFPYGYENMEALHGLTQTYQDKSEEFRKVVDEMVTFPDILFEDLM